MAVTIVTGITATQNETGATFTGGAITNSTIDNSPIGGVTPSTGSFTTVSANTGVFTGDVRVSGKVTVGQAVSALSFNAVGVVSAGGEINTLTNLVAGARTVVVSGDAGRINATIVSAGSLTFGGTSLSNYTEGVWTPADGSGASLSFTITGATYTRIGRTVFIQCNLAYPITANGANAVISGLPFTVLVSSAPITILGTNAAIAANVAFNAGATTMSILAVIGGAAQANSALSNSTVKFSGFYFV